MVLTDFSQVLEFTPLKWLGIRWKYTFWIGRGSQTGRQTVPAQRPRPGVRANPARTCSAERGTLAPLQQIDRSFIVEWSAVFTGKGVNSAQIR